MKHIERGETDIMLLADLNVDRHSLTSRLRERLRDIGKIAQNEVKIRVLVDRELTEAQKTQSRCLRRDDIVVFHQSISDGPAANEKYSVLGVKSS